MLYIFRLRCIKFILKYLYLSVCVNIYRYIMIYITFTLMMKFLDIIVSDRCLAYTYDL